MPETKTIKSVKHPEEGTKRPILVEFTDGTKAKAWPSNRAITAKLEEGVTAPAVIESKQNGQYTDTLLMQWGDTPAGGNSGGYRGGQGGGGRSMSPEERRSISAQACIKAACELFHGTGEMEKAAKAAQAFMKLHDHIVSTMPTEAK